MYGDYYMGGRQFDCLETLISYYMYYSEIIKGEKLTCPIAPPVIERVERTYVSTKPHIKKNNTNMKDDECASFKKKSKKSSSGNSSNYNGSDLDVEMEDEEEQEQDEEEEDNATYEYPLVDDDIVLYFENVGEMFRVFHEVGERGEWFWAQRGYSNEHGLLLAECVRLVVRGILFFFYIITSRKEKRKQFSYI